MYSCSSCNSPVIVDHTNPPVRTCECDASIVTGFNATVAGVGAMNLNSLSNNLTDESQVLVKAVLMALSIQEFIREGKDTIFVTDQTVVDTATGRKFKFNITGGEI